MENLNGLHSGVPRGAKTRREAPLLPLLRHQNTRFRPIQLFTKQFQSTYSRKPSFRYTGFSETEPPVKQILGERLEQIWVLYSQTALPLLRFVRGCWCSYHECSAKTIYGE